MQENVNHSLSISAILARIEQLEKSLLSYQQGRVEDRQRIERLEIRIESWVQGTRKPREPEQLDSEIEASIHARFDRFDKKLKQANIQAIKRHIDTLGVIPSDEQLVVKAREILTHSKEVSWNNLESVWNCDRKAGNAWSYFLEKRGWLEVTRGNLAFIVTLPDELL